MIQIFSLSFIIILIMSVKSFWDLWVSLELYSFLLTPWIMEGEGNTSKPHVFMYFLTQFLASMMFLVGSLTFYNELCLTMIYLSLLMKMSCFPFHTWFVNVIPKISWKKILILISLSKLLPLVMLNLFDPPKGFIWALIPGLLTPLGGFGTTCIRSIMAYSSVAHSSWLVICTYMGKLLSMYYITTYLVASVALCFLFMTENMTSMKNALAASKEQVPMLMKILALSGVPPFLGFIPKLMVIQALAQAGSMPEACVMGILSMLPVYFYFKTGLLSNSLKVCLEHTYSNSAGTASSIISCASVMILLLLLLSHSLFKMKY